ERDATDLERRRAGIADAGISGLGVVDGDGAHRVPDEGMDVAGALTDDRERFARPNIEAMRTVEAGLWRLDAFETDPMDHGLVRGAGGKPTDRASAAVGARTVLAERLRAAAAGLDAAHAGGDRLAQRVALAAPGRIRRIRALV